MQSVLQSAAAPPSSSFRTLYGHKIINDHHEDLGLGPGVPAPSIEKLMRLDLPVAIVGAGVAGLYTAMMLEFMGIDYEILEPSKKGPGGRLYTFDFPGGGTYDYYDVGAMRFPDTKFMTRTFDLFKRVKVTTLPYKFTAGYTFLYYNEFRFQRNAKGDGPATGTDPFSLSPYIGYNFVNKGYEEIMCEVLQPFRQALVDDYKTGFIKLMKYDGYSVRSYMQTVKAYPYKVVKWCETMAGGTGWYDRALSEAVLESLAFDYPLSGTVKCPPDPSKVDWVCIDRGTQALVAAMFKSLRKAKNKVFRSRAVAYRWDIRWTIEEDTMEVYTIDGAPTPNRSFKYSHIVSTIPLSGLAAVDMAECSLGWDVESAVRELAYGLSVKVGLKFKQNWWWSLFKIDGGQSYSDLPVRTVVYPSYGPNNPRSNVLIVSYTWTQDALRLGALVEPGGGWDGLSEEVLESLILRDLESIHGLNYGTLSAKYYEKGQIYGYNWQTDSLSMGAFAFFNPGQFSNLYPLVTKPACDGRLHFVGEATSSEHAWVVGALNSAWRGVAEIIIMHYGKDSKEMNKFVKEWGTCEEWDLDVLNKQVAIGAQLSLELSKSRREKKA